MDARPWPSLLLVGPTGAGKTPLGQELENRGLNGRSCVHFDFGANLRAIDAAPDRTAALTAAELAAVRSSLTTGALFEDRDLPMIFKILGWFTGTRRLTPDTLLVLNGLPRHRRQAERLSGIVAVERVVLLEADAAVILERIRLDPGGDRAARADDSLAALEKRLALFRDKTLPFLEFYQERGVPVIVIPVSAETTAGEMFDSLTRTINQKGEGP